MKAKTSVVALALVALATFTVGAVVQGYPLYPSWAQMAFCSYRPAC
jgi:hypothetical protein